MFDDKYWQKMKDTLKQVIKEEYMAHTCSRCINAEYISDVEVKCLAKSTDLLHNQYVPDGIECPFDLFVWKEGI